MEPVDPVETTTDDQIVNTTLDRVVSVHLIYNIMFY
jgi:hypothetical protein